MNIRPYRLTLVLVLVTALLAACGSPDAAPGTSTPGRNNPTATTESKAPLLVQLKQGESYRFELTMDQQITTEMAGDETEIDQVIGMTMRYDVERVDADGSMHIAVTYEAMSLDMEMPGMGEAHFDSTNPDDAEDEMFKGATSMLGKRITLTQQPDGSSSDIEGLDELLEGQDPNSAAMLKSMFGEESSLFSGQNGLGIIFPDKALGIGDSWTRSDTLPMGVMTMSMETTYTLKTRKDGVVTLDVDGTIETGPAPTPGVAGMELDYDLGGTQEGTLELDERTGLPRSFEMSQDVEGEMTMGGLSEDDDSTSVPMALKSEVTMKQVPCCEPLPQAPPRPRPTSVPMPDEQELEEMVRKFGEGSAEQAELENLQILSVRELPDGLLVVYSAEGESMISPGLGTPAPEDGELSPILGYLELTERGGKWRENGGSWSIGGTDQSELVRYGTGSTTGLSNWAAFLYAVPLDEAVTAIEVSFMDDTVVREDSGGPNRAMIVLAEGINAACELRVLGVGDEVLERIDLTYSDDGHQVCGQPPAPTKTPKN